MSLTSTAKNFLTVYTSDMEDDDYIDFMRELAEWATSQADIAEYRAENLSEFNEE